MCRAYEGPRVNLKKLLGAFLFLLRVCLKQKVSSTRRNHTFPEPQRNRNCVCSLPHTSQQPVKKFCA
jgi:hypothetical protein